MSQQYIIDCETIGHELAIHIQDLDNTPDADPISGLVSLGLSFTTPVTTDIEDEDFGSDYERERAESRRACYIA
jgi:hypothetical protein